MFFKIATPKGPQNKEGEFVTMHGINLVFCPVPGGFAVSHYETGLAIHTLDAISSPQHPVGFEEAKQGVSDLFEIQPELRAKIIRAASASPTINTLPERT